jgi:hypothetical protein
MPKWPKRKSFWVLLRREPVAIETQSGRARSFRAGYWIENLGWSPRDRKAPITRKGLIEMLDKSLKEEQAPRVDERLARVVRIIFEQYDGDVKAFVESIMGPNN